MQIEAKYALPAFGPEPENSQFPGSRTAISGKRYYSSSLGRFINRDPSEEQGGLNLYAFCRNNGVNAWDYLGMWDEKGNPSNGAEGFELAISRWRYFGANAFIPSPNPAERFDFQGWADTQAFRQNFENTHHWDENGKMDASLGADGNWEFFANPQSAPNSGFGQQSGATGSSSPTVHGQELLNSCGPGSTVIALGIATGKSPSEADVRNAIAQAIGKPGFNFAQQGLDGNQVRTGIPAALGQFGATGTFVAVMDSGDIASTLSGGRPVIFGVLNPNGPGNHLMVVQYPSGGQISGGTMLNVSNPWPANNSPAVGNPGQSYQISLDQLNRIAVGPAIIVAPAGSPHP